MNEVTITGLHKSYGSVPVLAGLDLSVEAGLLTAVLGPSGSGKTTLLRVLAGFERADAGQLSIAGECVDGGGRWVAPEKRRVGYVPQEGCLFPHLSVAANIGFGLAKGPGRRDRNRRVGELLELIGLDGMGERRPHELSGGQQQRVALARALAPRPRIVLLDEPFASLDTGLRATLRDDVREVLRAEGTTTVLVTHDQDEALSIADVVAVMRHGRIVQAGSPRELYDAPADAEVATFLGMANLVPGIVEESYAATPLGALCLDCPGRVPAGA
ncbi:MAG TPA: ABC transporter ATP-binding protein, partial [Actinomycetota bacterium]|nr:ABC transporter ATP-binding protein [Actinomycetota bacterium]